MKSKAKRGRPEALRSDNATLNQIARLSGLQCTQGEAAAVLGVSRQTLSAFMRRHPKARAAWERGVDSGKASLRRYQFAMARTNASMAIWLGKQFLGQREPTTAVVLSGAADKPIEMHDRGFAELARALDDLAASRAGGTKVGGPNANDPP